MKCYECIHLNSDKDKKPCCICIGRPHDLCCDDKFEPAKKEMVSAEQVTTSFLKQFPTCMGSVNMIHTDYLEGLAIASAENRDILYADLMENIEFNKDNLQDEGYKVILMLFDKINTILNPKQKEPVNPPPNLPRQQG